MERVQPARNIEKPSTIRDDRFLLHFGVSDCKSLEPVLLSLEFSDSIVH